ncbi:MAG: PAS domain S-box protein [Actinoplanes sp.]
MVAIVESPEDAVIDAGLDGVVRFANAAAERIFGYSPADPIGRHLDGLGPREVASRIRLAHAAVLTGQTPDAVTTRVVHGDGSIVDVALRLSPVRDMQRKIVGVSCTARDISAEVSARAASERRFRTLAVRAGDLALVTDPVGNLLYVSPAASVAFGYDPTTITGKLAWDFVHPDDVAGLKPVFDRVVAAGGPVRRRCSV